MPYLSGSELQLRGPKNNTLFIPLTQMPSASATLFPILSFVSSLSTRSHFVQNVRPELLYTYNLSVSDSEPPLRQTCRRGRNKNAAASIFLPAPFSQIFFKTTELRLLFFGKPCSLQLSAPGSDSPGPIPMSRRGLVAHATYEKLSEFTGAFDFHPIGGLKV